MFVIVRPLIAADVNATLAYRIVLNQHHATT